MIRMFYFFVVLFCRIVPLMGRGEQRGGVLGGAERGPGTVYSVFRSCLIAWCTPHRTTDDTQINSPRESDKGKRQKKKKRRGGGSRQRQFLSINVAGATPAPCPSWFSTAHALCSCAAKIKCAAPVEGEERWRGKKSEEEGGDSIFRYRSHNFKLGCYFFFFLLLRAGARYVAVWPFVLLCFRLWLPCTRPHLLIRVCFITIWVTRWSIFCFTFQFSQLRREWHLQSEMGILVLFLHFYWRFFFFFFCYVGVCS